MERIGFIGLGKMGRPMASNLCYKGARLVVYDTVREPMDALENLGAVPATSASEVASRADIIFTMLPDSAAVDAVVTDILAHAKAGSVVVDMSTIDPRVTDRLAAAAAANDIGFVDAPV